MAAQFPTTLPTIQRLSADDKMNDPGKEGDVLHNKLADEVEALAASVGITGSVVAGTVQKRLGDLELVAPGTPGGLVAHAADHAAIGGALKRRDMFGKNLFSPLVALGTVQTLGSVVFEGTHPSPKKTICLATSSGSTARILAAQTITVFDTAKFYEVSINVDSVFLQNPAAMTKGWLGLSVAPTSGTTELTMSATPPVAGTRYAFRFQPSSSSMVVRFGLGINTAETVVSGDSITFSDVAVYEVDSLTGPINEFSWSAYGVVGKAPSENDTNGSCVLICGDSWMNDATDPPGILSTTYRREVVVIAVAGDRLDMIAIRLNAALAAGGSSLNRPYQHIPGIAIIQGGINDVVADASALTMWTRLSGILSSVRALGIVPIVVLPVLASDSIHYTSARGAVVQEYISRVMGDGCDFIDTPANFLTTAGAADTTYLTSEAGAWIHLSSLGITKMAKLMDDAIRAVEFRGMSGSFSTW